MTEELGAHPSIPLARTNSHDGPEAHQASADSPATKASMMEVLCTLL